MNASVEKRNPILVLRQLSTTCTVAQLNGQHGRVYKIVGRTDISEYVSSLFVFFCFFFVFFFVFFFSVLNKIKPSMEKGFSHSLIQIEQGKDAVTILRKCMYTCIIR